MKNILLSEENSKEIEKIKYINIQVPVNYEEEDIPNDFPFRKENVWDIIVNVKTGEIINFPNEIKIKLQMKVTDGGNYILLDENKNIIAALYQEYVPDSYTIPGKYGDYILFDIEDGKIKNWYLSKEITYHEFFKAYHE